MEKPMSTLVRRPADLRSALAFVLAVVASMLLGAGAGYLVHPSAVPTTNTVYFTGDPPADTQTCVFFGPRHNKAC
jgi:hypothetical protein